MLECFNSVLELAKTLFAWLSGRTKPGPSPEAVQAQRAQAEQNERDQDTLLTQRAMQGDAEALEELRRRQAL